MPDIWVTTDLHLWSQDNDNRHPYRSQRQIDDLANMFAQTLREDDILIFLGDLCDPEASDINKVAAFVRSIPCMKYMCRGNHDTEDDAYYFEAGFDRVCDLIRMHNIIFSHKPVKVAPDEINVHGHLHTQKMSGLSYQHINAYAMRWNKEGPLVRLGDLLASATVQNPDIGGEVTSKMMEEFEFYTSLDNDHYRTIIDISDMVTADMISEAYEDTLVNIICFNDWINENFHYGLRINGVWDPKRNTTAQDWDNYLVVQSPQEIERSKVGVCWDYTSYEAWYFKRNFPKVKVTTWYIVYSLQPDCPTHTFLTFEYQGNHYYFESSFSDVAGVWAADSEKDILNFVIDSMVQHDSRLVDVVKASNYGLFKYDALNTGLYGLGCVEYMDWMLKNAKEVKHRYSDNYKTPVKMTAVLETGTDILDEILFQDTDDTKYWLADDDKYRKKAEKGEESEKSVVAIDESWFVVQDDIRINMDKWAPGNPLWVTGAGGDGKSTLAAQLAKEHNAEIVTMDVVLCRMGWSEEKFNKVLAGELDKTAAAHKMQFSNGSPAVDYVLSHPELPRNAKDPVLKAFINEITDPEMIKFCTWLMTELRTNPKYKNKLYIIEGSDICLMDPTLMVTKPLIIVGGSRIRSLMRRAKRDAEEKNHPVIKSILKYLKKYNYQNKRLDDSKDSFTLGIRNAMNESGSIVRRDTFEGFPRLWYASYDDLVFIIDRIPKNEHHYFYHGDCFKDTPWVVYRNAILIKNRGKDQPHETTGGAFIDVYYQEGMSADEAGILIGASPCARGKGYTDQLVKKALAETPDNIKTFVWKCAKDNKHSLNLAQRCGFVLDEKKSKQSKTDNYLRYERSHSNITEAATLDETPMASTIDDDFKGGKKLKLSSFKRQELTEQLRKKYSEDYPMLRHFYSNDNFHKAYIWTDDGTIVAGLCVSKPDDKFPGQTWITSLEITKDYRGHGLSKQLLDFACRSCKANALGVAEDNEIARRLYEKYGFKYGDDVGKKDHNGTNRLMYLGETASIIQEMAYEDAQDFMFAKLKHYCREFNRRDQEFERIKKSWQKEDPDCGDPPKLETILHHGNENQILFLMVRDMDTDHYTPNQVASYWHLIKHFTDEVKKDEEVQNYAPINDISCEAEDIVGIYVNLNRGVQESVVETHPMDRDEKKSVADKYGLKAVGQTHDEEEKDAAIAKQKELDRKKKERLKQLEKGRRTQKRNRTIKKIKSHLPGVKNEDTAVDGSAAEYLTDPNANVELDPFNRRVKPMHKGAGDNNFDDSIHEAASYQFSMMDNVQFFDGLTEAVGEDAEFAPVYVVLIRGNSPVSALISGFTGSEFTHASISFDSSLTEMYSFAGKNVANTLEAIIGGFKRENIKDKFYKENDIPYAVYLVESTKGAVKRMKKRLNYFIKNETKFTFDYLGLVKNFFKIPDDPKYTWFCSRFVADILNAGTPDSKMIATPSLYRPEDFKTADFAQLVDRGLAANYTSRNVDRQTKIIAKAAKVRNAKLHEGAMYPDNPYSHQVLQYQFAMMDEGAVDGFIQYLQSFKIRLDGDGNILITRREYDQLDSHFRESMRLIKAFEGAGNTQGVKDELCKINYMISLINQYYLREDVKNLKPTAKEVRKDMLDLRSVMMNVFRQHLAWVTMQDPKWNFQRYYDNSKYGKNVMIPKKVVTSVGRTIITALA